MKDEKEISLDYIDESAVLFRKKCANAMSERMRKVAEYVPVCGTVADIGCDHGYVSIYLLDQMIAEYVIAIEVRDGPLRRVQEHCIQAGLHDRMECRLSDGLDSIASGELDCAILAGMGGMLMLDILERGRKSHVLPPELVLQPQSDLSKIREYVQKIDYGIQKEAFLCERGKYYTVIKVGRESLGTEEPVYTEVELEYGRYLLQHRDSVLQEYLDVEYRNQEKIRELLLRELEQSPTDKLKCRKQSLEHQMEINREARRYYRM